MRKNSSRRRRRTASSGTLKKVMKHVPECIVPETVRRHVDLTLTELKKVLFDEIPSKTVFYHRNNRFWVIPPILYENSRREFITRPVNKVVFCPGTRLQRFVKTNPFCSKLDLLKTLFTPKFPVVRGKRK